ncbi:hypothetical protein EUX98_g3333 [Antrodiella citrinella]|uniref:ER-derived vesicles protein ERV14 n=1 Tax=Antrodiella citrinella TaxID=2447956 RepID=A0A4V3XIX2_9APHY|nr:hypothetical protein EUX98_g3333 [Antrodiella citrinella]
MMGYAAWLFLFAVFVVAALLFISIFHVIMYSDLESDYVNPVEMCSKLNPFVIPEALLHGFVTVLFLVSGQWIAFTINAPLLAYNVRKVLTNNYTFDATEIFRSLEEHKKESFAKLGFYLLCFLFYLYSMILAIVTENP